ncbi:MAG: endolytic transglycosylase MltG [Pseudomonadota bacterium]
MTSSKLSGSLFKLFGFLILIGSLVSGWLIMDYKAFSNNPLPIPPVGHHHIIPPGTSMKRLAEDLEQAGVVNHPIYLRWMARWQGKAGLIKAGEYVLPAGIAPSQLLDIVVSGAVVQHTLTIVEGWTFAQLLDAVRQHEAIQQTLDGASNEEIMTRLGHAGQHPEGMFMPDTYHFPRGISDVAFLQRAYQTLLDRLNEEWPKRDVTSPLKSAYQALILASIIEKETGVPEERTQIAGVFVRRLLAGMRLQTDPTVIYGLGTGFDGNLRRTDLMNDSPYNTYLYTGLPPTPIALPGLASIRAALHPAAGDTLFFVAKGDGSHSFSATLDQHNAAVKRYQLTPRANTSDKEKGN